VSGGKTQQCIQEREGLSGERERERERERPVCTHQRQQMNRPCPQAPPPFDCILYSTVKCECVGVYVYAKLNAYQTLAIVKARNVDACMYAYIYEHTCDDLRTVTDCIFSIRERARIVA